MQAVGMLLRQISGSAASDSNVLSQKEAGQSPGGIDCGAVDLTEGRRFDLRAGWHVHGRTTIGA